MDEGECERYRLLVMDSIKSGNKRYSIGNTVPDTVADLYGNR